MTKPSLVTNYQIGWAACNHHQNALWQQISFDVLSLPLSSDWLCICITGHGTDVWWCRIWLHVNCAIINVPLPVFRSTCTATDVYITVCRCFQRLHLLLLFPVLRGLRVLPGYVLLLLRLCTWAVNLIKKRKRQSTIVCIEKPICKYLRDSKRIWLMIYMSCSQAALSQWILRGEMNMWRGCRWWMQWWWRGGRNWFQSLRWMPLLLFMDEGPNILVW